MLLLCTKCDFPPTKKNNSKSVSKGIRMLHGRTVKSKPKK